MAGPRASSRLRKEFKIVEMVNFKLKMVRMVKFNLKMVRMVNFELKMVRMVKFINLGGRGPQRIMAQFEKGFPRE